MAAEQQFADVAGLRRAYRALREEVIAELALTGKRVRVAPGSFQMWGKVDGRWVRWNDGAQDEMRDIVSLRPGQEWRLTSRVAVPASAC